MKASLLRGAACALVALASGCESRALNGGSLDGGTVETVPFGGITSIATQQNDPWMLVVDGGEIFWMNQHVIGGFYKAPKTGGARVALYEGDLTHVSTFALDATSIYFPQHDADHDGIYALPRTGGAVRQVVSKATTDTVVVAQGFLYWEEAGPVVKKAPVTGGDATTVLLPSGGSDVPTPIVAAASDAVYASLAPDKLARIPLDGSAPTAVDSPLSLQGLAFDADTIYFVSAQGTAMRKSGGSPQLLVAGATFTGVAVDDRFVYTVEDSDDGRILKIPKLGGPASVVAEHQRGPRIVAADGVNLYWNCAAEGAVKWAFRGP